MLPWLFLPLIPAAALLGSIARAVITRDLYFALCVGGPALFATAVLFLALRVERFEIDAEGITMRYAFRRQVILKVPFARIKLSELTSQWPYKYGYLSMYAVRERITEDGAEPYLPLLWRLDLRGLSRDDIDWVISHPGLKIGNDTSSDLTKGTGARVNDSAPGSVVGSRGDHAERHAAPADMIGSTFIHETDPERLAALGSDIESLDDMTISELDSLTNVDFEFECSSAGISWSVGEPVVSGESLVVLRVSPEGVAHILAGNCFKEPAQLDDLTKLREFVSLHGTADLYEFTTF
jgi:hypothetical protein